MWDRPIPAGKEARVLFEQGTLGLDHAFYDPPSALDNMLKEAETGFQSMDEPSMFGFRIATILLRPDGTGYHLFQRRVMFTGPEADSLLIDSPDELEAKLRKVCSAADGTPYAGDLWPMISGVVHIWLQNEYRIYANPVNETVHDVTTLTLLRDIYRGAHSLVIMGVIDDTAKRIHLAGLKAFYPSTPTVVH